MEGLVGIAGIDILFYLFSLIIIACATLTVTLKHVLHSAICLMGCLFSTGALFLLMNAEFVALMQILVYVGGVVIFIIYAVLLTSNLGERYVSGSVAKRGIAGVCAFLFSGILAYLYSFKSGMYIQDHSGTVVTIRDIGMRLLSTDVNGFLIPFEVISVILLVALIAASTIARKLSQDDIQGDMQNGSHNTEPQDSEKGGQA